MGLMPSVEVSDESEVVATVPGCRLDEPTKLYMAKKRREGKTGAVIAFLAWPTALGCGRWSPQMETRLRQTG